MMWLPFVRGIQGGRRAGRAFLTCALFCFCVPVSAQQIQPPIPVSQIDPGTLGQAGFRFADGVPQVVNLIPHGNGARTGHLWIGSSGGSLRIIGEVDGDAPDWPKDANSILSKDHVEVWLTGASDLDLPPIGWGNQFGEDQLDSDKSCSEIRSSQGPPKDAAAQEKCSDWFTDQRNYRPYFKRLFVRQWLLANGASVESYATTAYGVVTKEYGIDQLAALKPHGELKFRSVPRAGKQGYIFEIDIPYSSFPPLNTLQLSEMRIMVDVFSAAAPGKKEGAFSTTSAARAFGKPETFNLLRFDQAQIFDVSPCGNKLEGTDAYGNLHPAWFIPKASKDDPYQADAFVIVNEARGYQYEPGDTISPTIRPVHFFWSPIGGENWVCGPQLTYRSGNIIRDYGEEVSPEGFDAKVIADGKVLIKEGPEAWYSEFGSGQCGACPRMRLKILTLDSNLNLILLLDLEKRIGGDPEPTSGDMTVSADWSEIVEYVQMGFEEDATWSSTAYCLKSGRYTECGRKKDVKPPDPPVIRQKLGQ
jgi:hypothetical protein